MAIPMTTNFLSYNGTGLDQVKCKWLNDLLKVTNTDFCMIQEHFRKNIGSYFSSRFPEYTSHVAPAARDQEQDSGRPKGGLAQLSNAMLNIKTERIKSNIFRLQAQVLTFPNIKLLWINTYFPTDPRTQNFNDDELMSVLREAEHIMDNNEYDHVLWGGDLNWDPTRSSGFSLTISAFMQRLGLQSSWKTHPVTHTHVHIDHVSTSILDHFMMDSELLKVVQDAGALHLGDNLSRHSPIMIKLKLGLLPKREKVEVAKLRRPAWYKAGEVEREAFKLEMRIRLQMLNMPECLHCTDPHCKAEDHSSSRDGYMLDVMGALIECSHSTIPMAGGKEVKQKQESIPGWNEMVEPHKEKAVLWHSIWESCGRPNSGEVKKIMSRTRNQYHYAVRKCKKLIGATKAQKLLEASEQSLTSLLEEMKKIKGSKKCKEALPATVAGATGEEAISKIFREEYRQLYNSHHDEERLNKLAEEVEENVDANSELEVDRITPEVLQAAMWKLKTGKGDVTGSYTSDAIRSCPSEFFEVMAKMFKSWLYHGTVTKSLLTCAYLPVYKGGLKDPTSCSSYRALAGTSVILKLFDYTVLEIWGPLLHSDSLQFAYKPNTSCSQASWLVMEVADHYRRHSTPCILTLLDCKQGFDRCTFTEIFSKLGKKLPAIVTRLFMYIYVNQEAWVRWGSQNSEPFKLTNSTRQGSVFSPTVWVVYVQELIKELRKLKIGCTIAGVYLGVVVYADDIALIAPNRTSMQIMLKVCENFAKKNNIIFSTDPNPALSKTKCLFMTGKENTSYPAELKLNGEYLPWVRHATHLGHELSERCNMELDTRIKRARFIENSTNIREMFSFAHPKQILQATSVYAVHMFGSNLWSLYGAMAGMAWRCWGQAVKRAWRVPLWTHRHTVDNLLSYDFLSLRERLLPQYLGFFQSLLTSASSEVVFLSNIVARDATSNTGRNLLEIKAEFGLNPWMVNAQELRRRFIKTATPPDDEWVLKQLENALEERLEREGEGEEGEDMDLLTFFVDSLCSM